MSYKDNYFDSTEFSIECTAHSTAILTMDSQSRENLRGGFRKILNVCSAFKSPSISHLSNNLLFTIRSSIPSSVYHLTLSPLSALLSVHPSLCLSIISPSPHSLFIHPFVSLSSHSLPTLCFTLCSSIPLSLYHLILSPLSALLSVHPSLCLSIISLSSHSLLYWWHKFKLSLMILCYPVKHEQNSPGCRHFCQILAQTSLSISSEIK